MQSAKKIRSVLLGSFFSFLVPLLAFLYLKYKGHDGHIAMPKHYVIDSIAQNIRDNKNVPDTFFHQISNLKLLNQLGDSIGLVQNFEGKILVVNFFFTTCQTICPTLTKNMALLNKAFIKNDTALRFVSISVDPITDSVNRLRMYADKYHANHDKWFFATGNKKEIYAFARQELQLNLDEGSGDENDFIHPEKFVLIDKYRNIRGYYNGLDSNNVRLCAEDIARLIVEKKKK
ncbi:MAG: SCO family protein [Chitinophagaceae bacterium]